MADADVLRSLRDQVLDESEPLAGLLRKCLVLGAITGSEDLRSWATRELKGYADDDTVPAYRSFDAPLCIDSMSGNYHATAQPISWLQIPSDTRELVPRALDFTQSVEELAEFASADKAIKLTRPGFALAAQLWSDQLPMFQDVLAIYYVVSPSTFAGMVGTVRTTLVEIVVDLAKDVPLDDLPSRAQIDSAVRIHVGSKDRYEVNVESNSGVIGQGPKSIQYQSAGAAATLAALIARMRLALEEVEDPEGRADVEQAVNDFEEVVGESDPEPQKVRTRSRALERVSIAVGSALLSQLAKDGVAEALQHFGLAHG